MGSALDLGNHASGSSAGNANGKDTTVRRSVDRRFTKPLPRTASVPFRFPDFARASRGRPALLGRNEHALARRPGHFVVSFSARARATLASFP